MKPGLVKMSLILCTALMAPHAIAQSPTQPHAAAKSAATKAPAHSPKTQTAAISGKAANTAVVATVTAAGSVIVLADGIVAHATLAQIQPPADGFVYER